MSHEAKPLSANEFLVFKAIVDRLTYADPRRSMSDALAQIGSPQGNFIQDAWQRAARRMWRNI